MSNQTPNGLGLTPNRVVGWRIKPDYYNFTVVVVKKHGESSSKAGQEYEEPLAYCRTPEHAAVWLFEHVLRVEGEALQDLEYAKAGTVASMQALTQAVERAREHVLAAIQSLKQTSAQQ